MEQEILRVKAEAYDLTKANSDLNNILNKVANMAKAKDLDELFAKLAAAFTEEPQEQ